MFSPNDLSEFEKKIYFASINSIFSNPDPQKIIDEGTDAVPIAIRFFRNADYYNSNQAILATALAELAEDGNQEAREFMESVANGIEVLAPAMQVVVMKIAENFKGHTTHPRTEQTSLHNEHERQSLPSILASIRSGQRAKLSLIYTEQTYQNRIQFLKNWMASGTYPDLTALAYERINKSPYIFNYVIVITGSAPEITRYDNSNEHHSYRERFSDDGIPELHQNYAPMGYTLAPNSEQYLNSIVDGLAGSDWTLYEILSFEKSIAMQSVPSTAAVPNSTMQNSAPRHEPSRAERLDAERRTLRNIGQNSEPEEAKLRGRNEIQEIREKLKSLHAKLDADEARTHVVQCPHCGNEMQVRLSHALSTGPCKHCSKPVTIHHSPTGSLIASDPSELGRKSANSNSWPWYLAAKVIVLSAIGLGAWIWYAYPKGWIFGSAILLNCIGRITTQGAEETVKKFGKGAFGNAFYLLYGTVLMTVAVVITYGLSWGWIAAIFVAVFAVAALMIGLLGIAHAIFGDS